MANKIERLSSVGDPIAVTSTAANNKKIPYGAAGGGIVVVDAVSGAAALNWFVATGPEATPIRVVADAADLTTAVTAGKAYALPEALFGAPFIVAASDAGTATIRVCVKG